MAGAPGPRGRAHHAARGPRQHRLDGLPPCPVDGQCSSVRSHDGDAPRPRVGGEPPEVAVHHGSDVRVHDRRRRSLVLPELGHQLARHGHGQPEPPHRVGRCPLVLRVRVRVEHTDRDRLRAPRADLVGKRREPRLVEWRDRLSAGAEATGDAEAIVTVHQRRWAVPDERVELGPVLSPDLDDVLEALVRDQHHARPAPLQERVGGHGRAVQQNPLLVPVQHLPDPVQHRLGGVVRGGRHLQGSNGAVPKQHEIGEGAPGVDGEERR